jgi:hypothetical protein
MQEVHPYPYDYVCSYGGNTSDLAIEGKNLTTVVDDFATILTNLTVVVDNISVAAGNFSSLEQYVRLNRSILFHYGRRRAKVSIPAALFYRTKSVRFSFPLSLLD